MAVDEDAGLSAPPAQASHVGAIGQRATAAPGRGIAFFDVDKTILGVNSAKLWLRRELAAKHITKGQALRATFWVVLYELGLARMEDVLIDAIKTLEGKNERDIIQATLRFYRDEVEVHIRPAARAAVQAHKDAGEMVFLLTSSSNYLSAPIADELKIDGFCANRFDVDAGIFTGRAHLPLCYGAGKVAHAAAVADKVGVALTECAFYTDSVTDLPMLEAVGRPVAVDPDPRLKRVAKKRGWPIQHWSPSTSMKALPP